MLSSNFRQIAPLFCTGVLLSIMPSIQASESKFALTCSKATDYLNKRDFYKAARTFSKVLSRANDSATAYRGRGLCELNFDLSKAISDFSKAIELDGSELSDYQNRAKAYTISGSAEKAIEDYSSIISVNPDYEDAFLKKAEAETALGNYKKAVEDYSRANRLKPNDAKIFLERSSVLGCLGENEKSQQDWNKAIALDSKAAETVLGTYQRQSNEDTVNLRASVDFVSRGDALASGSLQSLKNVDDWNQQDKNLISQMLNKIAKKAPGLIERAADAGKLRLVLSNSAGVRRLVDAGPERIMFYPAIHAVPLWKLEWALIHELTHAADTCAYISNRIEWNRIYVSRANRYFAKFSPKKMNSLAEPRGAAFLEKKTFPFGMPTTYSLTSPVEALAECSTAMIETSWRPPKDTAAFVEVNILTRPGKPIEEARLLNQAANASCSAEYNKAIDCCNKVLALNSHSAPALFQLAECHYKLGQVVKAESFACSCLKALALSKAPQNNKLIAAIHRDLGTWAYDKKDYKSTILELRKAEFSSASYADFGLTGFAFYCLGKYNKSIADYSKAIEQYPDNASYYSFRGLAFEKLKKIDLAEKDFAQAKRLKADFRPI